LALEKVLTLGLSSTAAFKRSNFAQKEKKNKGKRVIQWMLIASSTLAHNLLGPSLIHPNAEHKPRKYAEGPMNSNLSATKLNYS
jgi:hypothetical protein